jgi:hypothetical protein
MKFAGWPSLVIEYVQAIFLFNVASSRLLTCLLHPVWRFNVERPFLTAPGRLDPGVLLALGHLLLAVFVFLFVVVDANMRSSCRSRAPIDADQNRRN